MPYSPIKERGRGGFGVVEEVQNEKGETLARKTLVVPPTLNPADVRPRFEREVKYQSAINHDHVVPIYDHDLTATPPWFIMPLAICSLYDELIVDRHLGGDPSTPLFHILAGLEEMHRRGYCHRDLKPHNVLKFSIAGQTKYALSDFGLMAVGEDATSTLTPSGMGGGTPAYQAPECALNFKRATPRSDIYSFGAILHDIFAITAKRLPHEELTAPGEIGPVIERCTKRNQHRRFRDVQQLRDALYEALSGYQFAFESGEEQKIVEYLTRETSPPTSEEWDEIFDFLDTVPDDGNPTRNVYLALKREHIERLHSDDPDLMHSLGLMFARHCRTRSFDFNYCDVLAAKAQVFYDFGEVGLKADIAVAMLELGVSHNRFFVMRKFVLMASPTIDNELAERMVVEIGVLGMDFKQQFSRLVFAVSANSDDIHPALKAVSA